ncbi:MAG: RNA 2',3'-cyclic phosphodiesterase [Patescibacteria group bacterium]
MRLFVAIWLPAPLARAALTRLEGLRPGSRGVRWVKPDQLHLTLKFLGETQEGLLPSLEAALAGVASASTPIYLGLGGGGVFPPAGPPRVVWLAVTPGPELADLAARVERALAPLGFAPERRPFRPHLTLGRAEAGAVFDRELLARELQTEPVMVDKFSLVQSELRPGGAVYTNAGEWGMGR